MRNAGLGELWARIKIERSINNLRYVTDTTLMAESEEPLDEGEGGEWIFSLRLNIKKTKTMASGLITAWQIEGEKLEVMTDFLFLGSKKNHCEWWL